MIDVKPILFNTDMVRAILDGRKTVTRRAVKPQPEERRVPGETGCYIYRGIPCGLNGMTNLAPYRPGDILYVRETWGDYSECQPGGVGYYLYRADYPDNAKTYDFDGHICDLPRWRPSIHMPREAARIFLRVTNVRVERLQECGKGWCLDIEREGIVTPQDPILYINDDEFHGALRKEFQKLWNSTIKPADRAIYGWEANPYVWRVSFERISKEEAHKCA